MAGCLPSQNSREMACAAQPQRCPAFYAVRPELATRGANLKALFNTALLNWLRPLLRRMSSFTSVFNNYENGGLSAPISSPGDWICRRSASLL